MLNRPSRPKRAHWRGVKRKEERLRKKRKPSRITPARSIRDAVKKRGGETSRAILASENMLDQVAYIKIRIAIDMRLPSCSKEYLKEANRTILKKFLLSK